MKTLHYNEILNFWFLELKPQDWFKKNVDLDHHILKRFKDTHEAAIQCELFDWRFTSEGRLAEIIVLDQFSRNIYRDDPRAFASDALALALAQEAVLQGADGNLPASKRAFLYMPYMHSESKLIHEVAVKLFSAPGLEFNLEFELKHKTIIDRFGRYPHRNESLGRVSTSEEIEFLKSPNSSF